MTSLTMSFAGFRHNHILSLYKSATSHPEIKIVGACEEDKGTREKLEQNHNIEFSHETITDMINSQCDIVAIGDYFGRRGDIAIKALECGRHIICDKPLCTKFSQLNQIINLVEERKLKVGCMLTMRDSAYCIMARKIILEERRIGEVQAIQFAGQHPLNLDSRPGWYFEKGKHGGTLTDIAVHMVDAIPWITGLEFKELQSARVWNAFVRKHPHFCDAAQLMASLDNGCGVIGDVSYFAPNKAGYTTPYYWRTVFWGELGLLEVSANMKTANLLLHTDKKVQEVELPPSNSGGYLQSFLNDISETSIQGNQNTQNILKTMQTTLRIQKAANDKEFNVTL